MSQASNPVTFQGGVLSALDQFNEDFAASRAATGGPSRPPAGDWDNIVRDIEVTCDEDSKLKINVGSGEPIEIPGLRIMFTYQVLGGSSAVPPKMVKDQVWPGRAFLLPAGGLKSLPAATPKGKRQNFEIQLERLKGHLSTILGAKNVPPALGASLQAAITKIKASPMICRVQCREEKDEKNPTGRPFFEEFLTEALTA